LAHVPSPLGIGDLFFGRYGIQPSSTAPFATAIEKAAGAGNPGFESVASRLRAGRGISRDSSSIEVAVNGCLDAQARFLRFEDWSVANGYPVTVA